MKTLTIKWTPIILLVFAGVWVFAQSVNGTGASARMISVAATPELPRVRLNTEQTPSTGRVMNVAASAELQGALNRALPGDVIALKAGVTFTGNFILPAKTGRGWIVIRSSTPSEKLPPSGTRVTPKNAALLPKIVTPNSDAAIATAPGAHHYRLVGLEVGIQAGVKTNYGIIKLGDGADTQNSNARVPTELIIDRCYIHGNEKGDVSRGVALNSGRTAIIDSYISECHGAGFDTQAVCGWNGPGPYKIVNNYLEGSGENFMLGGADPKIPGLIPSDIEFLNNHVSKPLRWKTGEPNYAGSHWSVKNLFELKNAQRVLVEGNVFENNWADAQDGFAIVLKSVNQDGTAPWSVTRDVTFINNVILRSGAGINLLGRDLSYPCEQMQRILIRNNLWDEIDGKRWGGTHGRFLQISDAPNVEVDHNTIFHTGSVITTYGAQSSGFVYTNNLSAHNEYGVKGDGAAPGKGTLDAYMPNSIFSRNVLAGGPAGIYPSGNLFPKALADIGVIDRSGDFLRLSLLKPYQASGTDGKDLGCSLVLLVKATNGVREASR
ncbi:MAG TPA: hypothetical protein PLK30_01575 [Blastocatellia bacterium]|nr:hypothetical protein [Blastocatellia bacterium]